MSKHKPNKTKILMLLGHDFLTPKIDPRVYKESQSLIRAGFEVAILHLIQRKNQNAIFDQIQLFGLKDNIHLAKFKDKKIILSWPKIIWGYGKNLIQVLRAAKKIDFNIVHCHDVDTIIFGLLIKISRLGHVKLIYDSHEIATEMINFKSFKFFIFLTEKIASIFTDGFITVNETIMNFLSKRYPRFKKNALVIKNVPNISFFPKLCNIHQPLRFIYQGSLKKGRIEIVEAMYKELSRYDSRLWRLDILSNTQEIETNSVLAQNRQITVKQMIVDKKRFFQELAKYDLGIVAMDASCINHCYSLPNKIFDYMLSGVAVIAPDFPVIGKIIQETQTGYLLDRSSSRKSIKKTLSKIFENPAKITPKKQNGPKWIRKKYNWPKEEDKLVKFYRKFITFD